MDKFIEVLNKIEDIKVTEHELIKKYTTYKVGGPARYFVQPKTIDALVEVIKSCQNENHKYRVIGKGSNLLFSDAPYDGVIIQMDLMVAYEINDNELYVEAGMPMLKLVMKTAKLGLTGLEFAIGIPGNVGGSVYMNAGAYKKEMKDVVTEVLVLRPDLTLKWYTVEEMDYTYRHSMLQTHHNYICVAAKMKLEAGDKDEIMDLLNDRKKRRLSTQPINKPSAGSVFRNPLPDYSWKLIDECGLRGFRIGGAMISLKHSNFIVNEDHATAAEIKEIIEYVQKIVLEKKNIELTVEQQFVNWE
jgi:UDP-N-acetylmuramate dehydrogenase